MLCLFIACQLLTEEYTYREELSTPFTALIGEFIYKGKVSRDGIFIPDINVAPSSRMSYKFSGAGGMRHLWRGPGSSKFYELRYGMLIPMIIDTKGCFVPEKGGKIIPFEEYRYSLFARPIYNLPGTWVKKGTVFDTDEPPPKNISLNSGK